MRYLKFFGIISLFYSFIYFLIRGMLSLFLQKISLDLSLEISTLIAIFNLSYCFIQIGNGFLMDKFGLKIIAVSSILMCIIIFLLDLQISAIFTYFLIGLLGVCCSFATLNITFFVSKHYNSSLTALGILRFLINLLTGFLISTFKLPSKNTNLYMSIFCLCCGIFLFVSSKYLTITSKKKIKKTSRKECDLFFIFLCINGILSSAPFFFINAGFINNLFLNNISQIMGSLIYGFGFGNLFVILSEYINQRLIIILLCAMQFISLYSIFYNVLPIYLCVFFIGVSYACHIIPVMKITKKYKNPFFLAGFYNFIIMFFSSVVFIKLGSLYLKMFSSNINVIYNLIFLFFLLSGFNLLFSVFLFFFDKNSKIKANKISIEI